MQLSSIEYGGNMHRYGSALSYCAAYPSLVYLPVEFLLHLQPYVAFACCESTHVIQEMSITDDARVGAEASQVCSCLSPRLNHYVQMRLPLSLVSSLEAPLNAALASRAALRTQQGINRLIRTRLARNILT